MSISPRLPRRAVFPCSHCHLRLATHWVTAKSDSVVRRPWCWACCQGLDLVRYDLTSLGGEALQSLERRPGTAAQPSAGRGPGPAASEVLHL
jgi:hypothetical protein